MEILIIDGAAPPNPAKNERYDRIVTSWNRAIHELEKSP